MLTDVELVLLHSNKFIWKYLTNYSAAEISAPGNSKFHSCFLILFDACNKGKK